MKENIKNKYSVNPEWKKGLESGYDSAKRKYEESREYRLGKLIIEIIDLLTNTK